MHTTSRSWMGKPSVQSSGGNGEAGPHSSSSRSIGMLWMKGTVGSDPRCNDTGTPTASVTCWSVNGHGTPATSATGHHDQS